MGKRRMSNDMPGEDKREARARGGTPGARPTIGFLTVWTGSRTFVYLPTLWSGVTDAARERDANLICFAGGNLGVSPLDEFNAQRNVLFDLATPDAVDGLVIGSGILSLFVSPQEFQAFCDRYRPLPMVSIAVALQGIPSTLVDNVTGLRDAVNHLIEAHGYRRIACLRGPEGHEEADARYRAYAEALAAHGLPLNPDLVAPGVFSRVSGVEAMHLLLDVRGLRPGVDFEAVVAATDDMAFGALDVLQARGIQVPYDVALVGFNDAADTRVSTPALTTVRQPIYQQGKRAVEMLLALLAGEDVPEQVTLPTEMVVRQSCGCHSRSVLHAAAPVAETLSGRPAGVGLAEALITQREAIVAAMAEALASFVGEAAPAPTAEWAGQLLDGFAAAMKDDSPEGFLSTLDQVLRQVVASGDPTGSAQRVSAWQEALSALRSHLLPYLADTVEQSRAGNLWQQARLFIAEAAQQAERYRELQAEQQTAVLQAVGQAIVTTADMDDLMDVIARELPRLGIPSTHLSLYAGQEMPPQECRLILAYDEADAAHPSGRAALAADRVRFPSRALAPQGTLPQERSYRIVVEPLYFREHQLGLALFEVGPRDGAIYEMLREQISGALQVALLTQQVRRRALELQTAAEVSSAVGSILDLEELMQMVVELACERFRLYYAGLFLVETGEQGEEWAVLRAGTGEAGQKMVEQGHKLVVGGESMVGLCIANRRARIALDVGKEAARFNNPFLPKTRSELALPLIARDEAIGALTIQSTQEAAFTQEDIVVLQTMADQLANAITNARLYEALAQEQYLLHALLDSTPDHIYFKDAESRFIRASRSQADRFGLDDPTDIVGKIAFDFFAEEHARPAYEDEQRIVRTGEPVLGLEEKETWTDGSVSWFSTNKMPLRDETGGIVGTFGISSDITARKQAELALERRAVQLQTVAEVGREAAAILDVRRLLDRTVNLVSEGFGFYHVGIFLLEEMGRYAVLRAASSEGGRRMLERGYSLPVGQVDIVGSAAAANEPHIALDIGEDAVFFDNPDLPETRSEMALPLSVRGEVIGVLDVQSEEPSAFTEEDVATLRILADQLAVAIQNARLVERADEQMRELNLLYGQFSAETWDKLLTAERPMGYAYDRIEVSPVDELPSPAYDLAVERNKIVELDTSETSGSVLAVPLRVRGQVIGSLGVEAGDNRGWTPEEITLVEAVSEQVAQAVDGARLFAEAQKTALSMESLYQTSRAISSSLEEEEMIRAVLEAVYRTLNCEHVLLSTVDEEGKTIGLQHGIWGGEFDIYPEWKAKNQYPLDGNDIVPDIYRSGRTEIIGEWDDRFNREIWEEFGHERFLRVFMPINLRERVIGVIEVAFDKRRKDRISDDEVQMLAAFMDQAAVALENVRLFDQVQRRAQREHRIYEIANRLRRSPDISTILQTAVDELGQTLQVDRAMVRLKVKPRGERALVEEVARAEGQEQPVEG